MFKLLVFTAILALTKCDHDLEAFYGSWSGVKIYTNHDFPVSEDCSVMTLEGTDNHCKCGNNEQVPVLKMTFGVNKNKFPLRVVENNDQVEAALRRKCTCKDKHIEHFNVVFRYLTDNYFLAYNSVALSQKFAILHAKEVPSEQELEEFEKTVDVLKQDNSGKILCTKELKSGNNKSSNRVAAATTSWLARQPAETTTQSEE